MCFLWLSNDIYHIILRFGNILTNQFTGYIAINKFACSLSKRRTALYNSVIMKRNSIQNHRGDGLSAWMFAFFFILSLAAGNIATVQANGAPQSAAELVADMRLGWNLGNSLDAMHKGRGFTLESETFWGNPKTTKELISAVKNAGFRAIRIPVSYYNHLSANGTIDPAWLARIEEVVSWSLDNGLYTIINVHHDTGMNPSLNWIFADVDVFEKSRDDFAGIWTQVAAHFRNFDDRLIFQSSGEWMNRERSWNNEEDFRIVHELNQAFIDAVRSSGEKNRERYLMVSPYAASAEEKIVRAMLYQPFVDTARDKLILSVHSYATDLNTIEAGARALSSISQEFDLPVVVDEIGFPRTMRPELKRAVAEKYFSESAKAGMTCFFWDDGFEYVLIDRNTGKILDPELLEIALRFRRR